MATLKEYEKRYQEASNENDRRNAHDDLVWAERELARRVAPDYHLHLSLGIHASLKDTAEYDAFYRAVGTENLDA